MKVNVTKGSKKVQTVSDTVMKVESGFKCSTPTLINKLETRQLDLGLGTRLRHTTTNDNARASK